MKKFMKLCRKKKKKDESEDNGTTYQPTTVVTTEATKGDPSEVPARVPRVKPKSALAPSRYSAMDESSEVSDTKNNTPTIPGEFKKAITDNTGKLSASFLKYRKSDGEVTVGFFGESESHVGGLRHFATDAADVEGLSDADYYFAHYRARSSSEYDHHDHKSALTDSIISCFPWPPKGNCFFSGGYYEDTPEAADADEPTPGTDGTEYPLEYLKIEGTDDLVTEAELALHFPTAERIFIRRKTLPGDIVRFASTKIMRTGGSALIKFSSAAEAEKWFSLTPLRKLGPRTVDWLFLDEVRIENINGGREDVERLKKQFFNAKSIIVNKQKNQALITFRSADDATASAEMNEKEFMNLGERVFGWVTPQDAYLSQIPTDVKNQELVDVFPNAVTIHWLFTPTGRVALLKFEDALKRNQAFAHSRFLNLEPFHWEWTEDEAQIWEPGNVIPQNGIVISDLFASTTEEDIKNLFPTAISITNKYGPEREHLALLMFHSPNEAEDAFKTCVLAKLGARHVEWLFHDELKIYNFLDKLEERDVRQEFLSTQYVKLKKHREQAICGFRSIEDQKNVLDDNRFIRLGNAGICWKNNHESYLLEVPPNFREYHLRKKFPHAKKIKELRTTDGHRLIIIVHTDQHDQQKAFEQSTFPKSKTDKQVLLWPKK